MFCTQQETHSRALAIAPITFLLPAAVRKANKKTNNRVICPLKTNSSCVCQPGCVNPTDTPETKGIQ